ncbi:hypothetical protein B0H34DRAFT_295065 [Crassisporium funariophilum]|nr:hypothetical protein B0H34DRAFT_295065 [Crassisporium funariophilum]
MDIASAVYNLTIGIINFIAEHDDKDTATQRISNVVVQIQNIISPLLSREITNDSLRQCLQGLQDVLRDTHEHMRSWKESRTRRLLALINPWAVTQELRDDQALLMNQYIMLMGAMQVVEHVKGYNLICASESVNPTTDGEDTMEARVVLKQESDVDAFWRQYIGKEVSSVKSDILCNHLSSWMGKSLNNIACRRLLLRLDPNKTGDVTLATLKDLLQNWDMKKTILLYSAAPKLPLLIWIDDDVVTNAPKALHARQCGVTVVQIPSTVAAKAWIGVNLVYLKKHDNAKDIRFISDQVRVDINSAGVSSKNFHAGEEITKFIRGKGLSAPILIYTGRRSINMTRYVEKYPIVGSSTSNKLYQQYVTALGARRRDDIDWIKYGGK